MGGPSLPWRTYLARFFNLFPRFVVPWISESESDSATGAIKSAISLLGHSETDAHTDGLSGYGLFHSLCYLGEQ